jgi:type IV secretory pathway VirB3-like protein
VETLNEDQKQAFKQVKVLTAQDEFFGIPSKVFYNVIAFSIGLGVLLRSPLVSLIFLFVLGMPAYHIHKNDPFALQIWIRAVTRRYGRWCAGRGERRSLIILSKEAKE